MKFKVGDRVKFNSKSSNPGEGAIFDHLDGKLAKIIKIDEKDQELPYEIKFDHDSEMWMFEENLELVPVEENAQDPTPSPESETKVLTDKIAKMEKQIKLLKIMLQAQGYDDLELVLELLD